MPGLVGVIARIGKRLLASGAKRALTSTGRAAAALPMEVGARALRRVGGYIPNAASGFIGHHRSRLLSRTGSKLRTRTGAAPVVKHSRSTREAIDQLRRDVGLSLKSLERTIGSSGKVITQDVDALGDGVSASLKDLNKLLGRSLRGRGGRTGVGLGLGLIGEGSSSALSRAGASGGFGLLGMAAGVGLGRAIRGIRRGLSRGFGKGASDAVPDAVDGAEGATARGGLLRRMGRGAMDLVRRYGAGAEDFIESRGAAAAAGALEGGEVGGPIGSLIGLGVGLVGAYATGKVVNAGESAINNAMGWSRPLPSMADDIGGIYHYLFGSRPATSWSGRRSLKSRIIRFKADTISFDGSRTGSSPSHAGVRLPSMADDVRGIYHYLTGGTDQAPEGARPTPAPADSRPSPPDDEVQPAPSDFSPAGDSVDVLKMNGIRRGRANLFSSGRMRGTPGDHGNMTKISVDGHSALVNKRAAPLFQAFVDDLERRGYKIKSLSGFNDRLKRGGRTLSEHAYGNAIDINPLENPMGRRGVTDLPQNISDIAASYGLTWGGDWRGRKDTMHFEWAGVPASVVMAERRQGAKLAQTPPVIPVPAPRPSPPIDPTGSPKRVALATRPTRAVSPGVGFGDGSDDVADQMKFSETVGTANK